MGDDGGQGGLAAARRAIEDGGGQPVDLDGAAQQPPGAHDMLLADKFVQGAGAHPIGQGRVCLFILRKQRHAATLPVAAVPDGFPVRASDDNADESLDRLMAIVESLPSMQQTILRLRHMEGMEMSDIAEITGSNEVAVRKALSRARQAVRMQFLKQDNPE